MSSPERQVAPEGFRDVREHTPHRPVAHCNKCGRAIGFEPFNKTSRPIDPDGRLHWSTCPMRKRSMAAVNECSFCHSTNTRRGPGNDRVPATASLICNDCGRRRWLPFGVGQ